MFKNTALATVLAAGLFALAASPAFAQLKVTAATTTGTGCPAGSTRLELEGDLLTVQFSQFQLSAAGMANCQIDLDIQPLGDMEVKVKRIDWRGTASVEQALSTGVYSREMMLNGTTIASGSSTFGEEYALVDFDLADSTQQIIRRLRPSAIGEGNSCGLPAKLRANASFQLTGDGSFSMPVGEPAIMVRFEIAPCEHRP